MFKLIAWVFLGLLFLLALTALATYMAVYQNAESVAAAIVNGDIMSSAVVIHTENSYTVQDILKYGFFLSGCYFLVCILVGIYRGLNK